MIKLIFIGSGRFGMIVLSKIVKSPILDILFVITKPKMPKGRNLKLTKNEVHLLAEDLSLKVKTPDKLETILNEIKLQNPDVILVASYGKLIPKSILKIPKYGVLNLHPSLLPKYRGPSPIQYVLLNKENITGTSLMLMDEGFDTGPIIAQTKIKILEKDNFETLELKLAKISAELFLNVIKDYVKGKIKLKNQDHSKASYTKIIKKQDGLLNFDETFEELKNKIRAFFPWPSCYFYLNTKKGKKLVKIFKISKAENISFNSKIYINNKYIYLKLKDCIIKVLELQIEGRKRMQSEEFLRGYKNLILLNSKH